MFNLWPTSTRNIKAPQFRNTEAMPTARNMEHVRTYATDEAESVVPDACFDFLLTGRGLAGTSTAVEYLVLRPHWLGDMDSRARLRVDIDSRQGLYLLQSLYGMHIHRALHRFWP